jgi:oligopeptide/dipeptide ABC transporter ATP-binding protein
LEVGVTIAVASRVILAVSFTLTPMLAARWLGSPPAANGTGSRHRLQRLSAVARGGIARLTAAYEQLLRSTLRARPAVLLVAAAAAATSVLLVTTDRLPSSYVPAEDTGEPPNLVSPPSGCRFHPRCPFAMPVCRESPPPAFDAGPGQWAACWLLDRSASSGDRAPTSEGNATLTVQQPPQAQRSKSANQA